MRDSGWWVEHWRTVILSACVALVLNVATYGFVLSQLSSSDVRSCSNVLALRDGIATIFLRAYGSTDPDAAQRLAVKVKLPVTAVPTAVSAQNRHLTASQRRTSRQFFEKAILDLTRLHC